MPLILPPSGLLTANPDLGLEVFFTDIAGNTNETSNPSGIPAGLTTIGPAIGNKCVLLSILSTNTNWVPSVVNMAGSPMTQIQGDIAGTYTRYLYGIVTTLSGAQTFTLTGNGALARVFISLWYTPGDRVLELHDEQQIEISPGATMNFNVATRKGGVLVGSIMENNTSTTSHVWGSPMSTGDNDGGSVGGSAGQGIATKNGSTDVQVTGITGSLVSGSLWSLK
jgi:hypothetical protein